MISVEEALQHVLSHTGRTQPVRAPVLDAVGLTLAEQVTSDVDSPPHDKAMVDGYAVAAADLTDGPVELAVIEEVTAGAVPTRPLAPGQATRIMTGAPVPEGAAAVVMVEQTELIAAASKDAPPRVRIDNSAVTRGGNILPRAASLTVGQVVLQPGAVVRPIEVGVLAEVGRTDVEVFARPRLAVMTSGNELVTPDVVPGPGQIRNSNNPMLVALARRAGAEAIDLGIARDEEDAIGRLVDAGLSHEVLVLSGGVSAGVLDLVPQVLAAAGVRQVFHKVRLKPGKPLWFGVFEGDAHTTLVFGLPGNPVSALVCFELFVRAAIAKLAGRDDAARSPTCATLAAAHRQRGDRPVYFPGVLSPGEPVPQAAPLPWQGSADLSALAQANCLIAFGPGEREYAAGEAVDVFTL